MRLSKGLLIGGLVSVASLAWLLPYGCGKKPTEPPRPEEPKDYAVYCWDGSSDLDFFAYYPATDHLDTFTLPTYAWRGIFVSADGKKLYSAESTRIAIADLTSREVVDELPYAARRGIFFSMDGRFIALSDLAMGLLILDADDYTLLFHDTSAVLRGGCFSADGNRFYATSDTLATVYVLDIENDFSVRYHALPDDTYLLQILPSLDETKWFLYRCFNDRLGRFDVYEVQLDSIIFRHHLNPGNGEMVVTPDGHYVFYTQPGPPQRDYNGPPDFTVFDVQRNRIDRRVCVIDMIDGIHPVYLPMCELAITPDGRWLVVGGFDPTDCFVVLDITNLSLVNFVEIPDNNLMSYTCQSSL